MKIILTKDMDALGLAGEIFNVAKGYARNYLIPQGFAVEATEQNFKLLEKLRKKIEVKKIKAKEDAETVKKRMADLVVTISQKVGEEDKLYGSVTTMDIAAQLEKQGVNIDRRKINLDRPIKTLGEYAVHVKLHPEVTGSLKVVVIPEEQKA
ncbi:MAG: 50S ribosomal protein L9 [Proteobacteria bacterium]|nr:50S ribosomal protein L9 [Pseudomonadota bacterium]